MWELWFPRIPNLNSLPPKVEFADKKESVIKYEFCYLPLLLPGQFPVPFLVSL